MIFIAMRIDHFYIPLKLYKGLEVIANVDLLSPVLQTLRL